MFDFGFFDSRKKELEIEFNSIVDKIKEAETFIKNSQIRLAGLSGSYQECEVNITKLKEKVKEITEEAA
jgi:hypothetical protein